MVLNALNGNLPVNRTETKRDSSFLTLGNNEVNYPDPRRACWLYTEIRRARNETVSAAQTRAAADVYRPDLYEAALGSGSGPEMHEDPIGLRYGSAAPRGKLEDYIATLAATAP